MGSHYGTCEIIELEDEPKSSDSRANDKGKKPQESKSIQEDINKLFEAINVRTSFRGLTETGGTTPRNPSKRPMRVSTSFSTGIGYSEPVSLKQALRGLSISHASEMAAMKRLSKSNNNNLKPSLPLTSEKSTKNVGTTVQMNEISVQEKNIISIGFRSCSIVADKASESSIMNDYEDKSMKAVNKATVIKLRRKGRLLISSNKLVKSTRASTPNKQNLNKKSPSITMENDIFIPDKSQLLCQRCHCVIKDAQNNNMNSKCENQSDFTQSSNSSIGEYSSSTSISEESHVSSRCSIGNRPHMSTNMRWHAIQNTKKQNGFLALKHFNLLKKLGSGDIGTVYLAELTGTNCLFAIKVMDNEFLERRKKMGRAHTEREILRILDHPFLPTLYAHFVSDNLSCLVMEYCPGGDLHVLRQKQPGRYYHEQAARFYVAEVLLALEYLHMLGIIYRDLKPENILVRQDGHIMLTDFDLSLRCSSVSPTLLQSPSSYAMQPHRMSGSNCIDHPLCSIKPTCHQVSCFSPRIKGSKKTKRKPDLTTLQLVAEPIEARSNSFVGTHEYLAPEIIKGNGHGSAVDWWTFGIFLYELLYGKTPFKGLGNDETLANVVMESLKFPDTPLVSFQARDLINRLLVKEPENRLGSQKGAAEIKQHPFFDGLNWALIRCAIPPEVPECYDIGADKSSSVKFEIF